jgi:HlyD family secretion protein
MKPLNKTWLLRISGVVAAVVVGVWMARQYLSQDKHDQVVVNGNGRVEATEIDVAARSAGRVKEILVGEGEFVKAGQVLARIDADSLNAQLRQADAQARQARNSVTTARSQLAQRQSEKAANEAIVTQREAELAAARSRSARSSALVDEGASSRQEADDDRTRVHTAESTIAAARAQVAAAQAAIITAQAQVRDAQLAEEAAMAAFERVRLDIADNELKAPRDGRIQFRVVQPGEVVAAGGKVLNMIDLSDVYMTFFLPEAVAGAVALGSDVRIVLDAAPQYVIPAKVSFVASAAQFTPKTVETASERQKLMFRVKARIDRELLQKHLTQVKSGLPGVGWLKLDGQRPWPAELAVKVPQ